MDRISKIEEDLYPLKKQLSNHELYKKLESIEDIRIFMEGHVYAVWDFMSLLKALQNKLTCVTLPWRPAENPEVVRFVNEIVWGEESDVNEQGAPKSHFEMYLDAMKEVGADTSQIVHFIDRIQDIHQINEIIQNSGLETHIQSFLNFTFGVIQSGESHKIAAAFTFGREDLIPDMFLAIIRDAKEENKNSYPKLSYYLERHIELDGDEHGPLAMKMIKNLCGEDDMKWEEVKLIGTETLKIRIILWDGISKLIVEQKSVEV